VRDILGSAVTDLLTMQGAEVIALDAGRNQYLIEYTQDGPRELGDRSWRYLRELSKHGETHS
jgi:hypothetical protein